MDFSVVTDNVTRRESGSGHSKRVVCYYTNWSVYRPGTAKFSPQNINPYLCTHLIYAFGGLTRENSLRPYDKYQDIEQGMSLLKPLGTDPTLTRILSDPVCDKWSSMDDVDPTARSLPHLYAVINQEPHKGNLSRVDTEEGDHIGPAVDHEFRL